MKYIINAKIVLEREIIENYVRDTYPLVECYFIDGGQDIYSYIMVAE